MNKAILFGAILLTLSVAGPAGADALSDRGEQYFKNNDFKNAAIYFAQSLRANPATPRALYLSAVCLQRLGNRTAANNGFMTVVQMFPRSQEAALARQAMGQTAAAGSPSAAHTVSPQSSVTGSRSAGTSADQRYVTVRRTTADTGNARTGITMGLSRIPRALKDAVFGDGCKVLITPTILEHKPELATTKPRGYSHGGGYDNCPAMYMPTENEILVAEKWGWKNGPPRPGTAEMYEECLGHEFGHAFDAFLGKAAQGGVRRHYYNLTESSWFADTYTRELNSPNEQRRAADYYTQKGTAGPSELFAELFGSIFSVEATAEQRRLAQFFPQTRAKIQQLASLTSFTQDNINAVIPALGSSGSSTDDDDE